MHVPQMKLGQYLAGGVVLLVLITAGIGVSVTWSRMAILIDDCRDTADVDLEVTYNASEVEVKFIAALLMTNIVGTTVSDLSYFLTVPSETLSEVQHLLQRFSADNLTDPDFISSYIRPQMLVRIKSLGLYGIQGGTYETLPFSPGYPDANSDRGGLFSIFQADKTTGSVANVSEPVYLTAETRRGSNRSQFGTQLPYTQWYPSWGFDDPHRELVLRRLDDRGATVGHGTPCFWDSHRNDSNRGGRYELSAEHSSEQLGSFYYASETADFSDPSLEVGECFMNDSDVFSTDHVKLSRHALFNVFAPDGALSHTEAPGVVEYTAPYTFHGTLKLDVFASIVLPDIVGRAPNQEGRLGVMSLTIEASRLSLTLGMRSLPRSSVYYIVDQSATEGVWQRDPVLIASNLFPALRTESVSVEAVDRVTGAKRVFSRQKASLVPIVNHTVAVGEDFIMGHDDPDTPSPPAAAVGGAPPSGQPTQQLSILARHARHVMALPSGYESLVAADDAHGGDAHSHARSAQAQAEAEEAPQQGASSETLPFKEWTDHHEGGVEEHEFWTATKKFQKGAHFAWFVTLMVPRASLMNKVDVSRVAVQKHQADSRSDSDDRRVKSMVFVLGLLLGISFLLVGLAVYLVGRVVEPILLLAVDMEYVSRMQVEEARQDFPPSAITEIGIMQHAFAQVVSNLQEFKQYIPQSLILSDVEDITGTGTNTGRGPPNGSLSTSDKLDFSRVDARYGSTGVPNFLGSGGGGGGGVGFGSGGGGGARGLAKSGSSGSLRNSLSNSQARSPLSPLSPLGSALQSGSLGAVPMPNISSASGGASGGVGPAIAIPPAVNMSSGPSAGRAGELKAKAISVIWFNVKGWHSFALATSNAPVTQTHSEIMACLVQAIQNSGGVQDVFSGDRLMGTFNAFSPNVQHRVKCVTAGAAARTSFSQIRVAPDCPPLGLTFGCGSGDALIGHMGCLGMKRVTVTSAVVGWVFALERYTRFENLSGCVDMFAAQSIVGVFDVRFVGQVLYPKRMEEGPIRIYEFEERPAAEAVEWMYAVNQDLSTTHKEWNTAWERIIHGEWDDASRAFLKVTPNLVTDKQYQTLREVVEQRSYTPPTIPYH